MIDNSKAISPINLSVQNTTPSTEKKITHVASTAAQISSLSSKLDEKILIHELPHYVLEKIFLNLAGQDRENFLSLKPVKNELIYFRGHEDIFYSCEISKFHETPAYILNSPFNSRLNYLRKMTSDGYFFNKLKLSKNNSQKDIEKFLTPFLQNQDTIKTLCLLLNVGFEQGKLSVKRKPCGILGSLFIIVKHVVSFDPSLFDLFPEEIKKHKGICSTAVRKNSDVYDYLNAKIQQDLGIILELLKNQPLKLSELPHSIRDNSTCVLVAVNYNGLALEFASQRLQEDPSIVQTAVRMDGLALQFASERQRDEPSTVNIAINSAPSAIKFASNNIQLTLSSPSVAESL